MAETEREERHFLEHRGEHRQEGIAQTEDDRRTEDGDIQITLGGEHEASPSPLERRYSDVPLGSALSALMCTRRRTPVALQAATIFFGSSTWASAKSRL
jgi:hypothetical protein